METIKLPSRFQINEEVVIDFGEAGMIHNAAIIKVHFTESKVLYDVEVIYDIKDTDEEDTFIGKSTRVYNVDSVFVKPAEGNY